MPWKEAIGILVDVLTSAACHYWFNFIDGATLRGTISMKWSDCFFFLILFYIAQLLSNSPIIKSPPPDGQRTWHMANSLQFLFFEVTNNKKMIRKVICCCRKQTKEKNTCWERQDSLCKQIAEGMIDEDYHWFRKRNRDNSMEEEIP